MFQPLGSLRGDWAFVLKAGVEANGGRRFPLTAELWAIPLAGGQAVLVARYLEPPDSFWAPKNALRRQFAADGRRIVLSIAQPPPVPRIGLVILDLERGTISSIGQDQGADHLQPAWSPDGTKIAYVRRPLGSTSDDGLWVMNADGSLPRRIVARDPSGLTRVYSWKPGSTAIGFDRFANGEMHEYAIADLATGKVTSFGGWFPSYSLEFGESTMWRATGPATLAAGISLVDGYAIEVAETPAVGQKILVREPDTQIMLGVPRWHPSTDEVLYRRLITAWDAQFYVVRGSGGTPQRIPLATHPYLAEWMPGGDGIVYLNQSDQRYSAFAMTIRIACRDGGADHEIGSIASGGLSDLIAFRLV